mgnify:CR=1 FL=1
MREIQSRFYTVAGNRESAYRIQLAECSRTDLEAVIGTGSLFREKRLVLLEEPGEADGAAAEFLASKIDACASSDDVFVAWDSKSQKNAHGLLKILISKAAKIQEFSPLSPRAVAGFLEEELRERRITLSAKEKYNLIASYNGNTWLFIQNLETQALRGEDMECAGSRRKKAEYTVFSFTDAFGLRQRAKTICIFYELIHDGIEPERLFWALSGHLRALLSVGSLVHAGVRAAEIPKRVAFHPFVVKKAAEQIQRFSLEELTLLYQRLTMLDFEIKQSRGDVTLGLERILLSL